MTSTLCISYKLLDGLGIMDNNSGYINRTNGISFLVLF